MDSLVDKGLRLARIGNITNKEKEKRSRSQIIEAKQEGIRSFEVVK
ncbi:MAG: hypothetical protein WCX83_03660 [Candidatus Cloacimonas sp.]